MLTVYGHRGAAGEAPENTIAGCRHAVERGVRHIEIDLRLSADGKLVVIHDQTLERTTGRNGAVSALSAARLARLHAGRSGPPWADLADTGVPTLEALFAALPQLQGMQLEVKPDTPANLRTVVARLLEFLPAAAEREIFVTSSSVYLHRYLAKVAPGVARGLVVWQAEKLPRLEALGCRLAAVHWSLVDRELVAHCHALGIEVSVWTVNDASVMRRLHQLGVDSVISDYPSMALPLAAQLAREAKRFAKGERK